MPQHAGMRRSVRALSVAALACLALVGCAALADGGEEAVAAANLPGFGAVRLIAASEPDASPPAAQLLLQQQGGAVVYRFAPPPGSGEFAFYRVAEAGFTDLDGDGQDDLVAVIEYVTGIGPGGAEPFPLAAVYLRRGDAFEPDMAREARVNEPPAYDQWRDLATLLPQLNETR
jgi:hypothetical protein